MSTFKNNGITMQGAVAMAALVAGGTLEFTRISVGDGEIKPDQTPMTMKDLNHRLFDVNINEVYSDSESQATVIGVFNNSQTETGFFYRELGLFAKDPATGAEILYCYGNAGSEAEWISPAGEESVIEKEVHIVTLIGGATTVTASLKSGIYPTIEQTQKWLAEKYDKTGGPISGDVQISGATSMKGGLNVEGGTTTDTINITGKATINGGVSITGGASVDDMNVTGSLTVPMPEKDTDAANQQFVNQQIENKTEFKKLEFVNPEIIKGQAPAEAKQVGIEYFGKEKGTKEARLASLIYQLSADMTAALQMMVNDPTSDKAAGIIVSFKDGKPRLALTNHPEAASNDHSIATTNWVRGIRATADEYGLVRVADQEDVLKDDCGDAAIVPSVYHDVSDYRHKNTAYVVGDIVRCMFNSELFLECTKAGTTSAEPLDTRAVKHGQILEDGTLQWTVRTYIKSINGLVPDKAGNVTIETTNDNKIKEIVLNTFFPVGSTYISADANFNPNSAWGGQWTKIENRFLLGSGSRAVGNLGGEENVTLTEDQMPAHVHNRGDMNIWGRFGTRSTAFEGAFYEYSKSVFNSYGSAGVGTEFSANRNWSGTTGWQGGNQAHNNMPPYEVVNIWKRTA